MGASSSVPRTIPFVVFASAVQLSMQNHRPTMVCDWYVVLRSGWRWRKPSVTQNGLRIRAEFQVVRRIEMCGGLRCTASDLFAEMMAA